MSMAQPIRDSLDGSKRTVFYGGVRAASDPNNRVCQWCGKTVTGRRRTFCSQECVDELLIRSQPGYARKKVFERDCGVCAICGLDTYQIESLLKALHRVAFDTYWVDGSGKTYPGSWMCVGSKKIEHPASIHRREQLEVALAILGMWAGHSVRRFSYRWESQERSLVLRSSLWQMDHIHPVVEGGGQCGLDNLRTLCLRCHKNVTAELVSRRTQENRAKKIAKYGPPKPRYNFCWVCSRRLRSQFFTNVVIDGESRVVHKHCANGYQPPFSDEQQFNAYDSHGSCPDEEPKP